METTRVWNATRNLGAAEIIRRTANTVGVSADKVASKVANMGEKLVVATDTLSAFFVACEMGAAEKIVDKVGAGVCPECGTALICGMGNDPMGDDGVRCPNGCDLR